MERSEPSLVPEWLKGASGGGGATHHCQPSNHQEESAGSFPTRQRTQPHSTATGVNHGEYDASRYGAASDRTFYPSTRRGTGNSAGAIERPQFDRDSYSRNYSSFGRSSGYRSYDGGLEREREVSRDRDWDWDRERDREFRDRERERALGFGGGDDRDRDRERSDATTFRRPASGIPGRYDGDMPLRRSQSMGASRVVENGDKKVIGDAGSLPTAPPASSGSLTSSMQKAAFERNFPSLGAQERQGAVQSSLGNVSALSPRPSWQASSPRPDVTRSSASSPGLTSIAVGSVTVGSSVCIGVSGIGAEGWSSALAEAPSLLNPPVINGVVTGMNSVSNVSISTTPSAPALNAPPLSTPKIADALAQIPPRVRTPPQFSMEPQRMEESVVKQSRQLIPMKPSLPKNMGPREKTKPKVVRAVDVVAPPSGIKLSQPVGPSQLVTSPYRPLSSPRADALPLKATQGKLLVRKSSKEAVAAAIGSGTSLKLDVAISTSSIVAASSVIGIGGAIVSAPNTLAAVPRKQKQLLDRRAVPIPPMSVQPSSEVGSGVRAKDGGSGSDDRRTPIPAQNRSDFFNALRKKASGVPLSIGLGSLEKVDAVAQQKGERSNGKGVEVVEEGSTSPGSLEGSVFEVKENGTAIISSSILSSDTYGMGKEKVGTPSNGVLVDGIEGVSEEFTAPNSPLTSKKRATATEEEEAAFLRSLGWEESADLTDGEGLTEEEINSFYQERLRAMSMSPSVGNAGNHRLRDVQVGHHVGSIGSVSSGISSSDSESDDELHVRRRS